MQSSNNVKNLLDADKNERRAFLNSFDSVLADCDGKTKKHFFLYKLITIYS